MSETINVNDLLNEWKDILKQEDPYKRLCYAKRREHIELLVERLRMFAITFDEAKLLKQDVLRSLISKEGLKGKAQYKGWKENILDDFDSILAGSYLQDHKAPEPIKEKTGIYLSLDIDISDWFLNKYNYQNEKALDEAHRIGSIINLEFANDYFK